MSLEIGYHVNIHPHKTARNPFCIYDGINTGHWRNLPLPAINLPYLTLAKYISNPINDNHVHKINADVAIGPNTSKLILLPGEIKYHQINNSPEIIQAKSFFNNICTAEWDFTKFYKFKSKWIASDFNLKTHTTDGAPFATVKYHLISAKAFPLDKHYVDLSKQLKTGDLITMNNISFRYNPQEGSIYQQEKYQRKYQTQNIIKSHRLKLIEVLIIILFISLSMWRLLYVLSKRKNQIKA